MLSTDTTEALDTVLNYGGVYRYKHIPVRYAAPPRSGQGYLAANLTADKGAHQEYSDQGSISSDSGTEESPNLTARPKWTDTAIGSEGHGNEAVWTDKGGVFLRTDRLREAQSKTLSARRFEPTWGYNAGPRHNGKCQRRTVTIATTHNVARSVKAYYYTEILSATTTVTVY